MHIFDDKEGQVANQPGLIRYAGEMHREGQHSQYSCYENYESTGRKSYSLAALRCLHEEHQQISDETVVSNGI